MREGEGSLGKETKKNMKQKDVTKMGSLNSKKEEVTINEENKTTLKN